MPSTCSRTTYEGLAVVTGAGWLSFHQLRILECTCLYVCGESRRQVVRRVRVVRETPRSLWCRAGGATAGEADRAGRAGGAHRFAWHSSRDRGSSTPGAGNADGTRGCGGGGGGGGDATADGAGADGTAGAAVPTPATITSASAKHPRATTSTNAHPPPLPPSRVPPITAASLKWQLPATEFLSAGFLWPRGVKEVHFGPKFNDMIDRVSFPETLETLSFGFWFNQSLGPGRVRWPPALKRLTMGAKWNRRLAGARAAWPASLEMLKLGTGFNQPLKGGDGTGLPPGLLEIDLGGVFDQPLAGVEFPPLLRKLTLSEYFDQSLEFAGGKGVVFPRNLREIEFGGRFNQAVDGVVWPEGLRTLSFGDKFDQAFAAPGVVSSYTGGDGGGGSDASAGGGAADAAMATATASRAQSSRSFVLPAGLQTLLLGNDYNHPLGAGELPEGLERLALGKSYSFVSSVRWPAGLKRLELSCRWGSGGGGGGGNGGGGGGGGSPSPWLALPPLMEYLDAGPRFNSPLDRIAFPRTLRVLDLGEAFDHPLDHPRPPSAAADGEDGENLSPWPPLLPDGLEELRLGKAFSGELEGVRLPGRLRSLVFAPSSQFDRPLAGVAWPSALEELRLGNCFDQRMEGASGGGGGSDGGGGGTAAVTLPAGLRELSFGYSFSHSLEGLELPPSLARLTFAARYPLSHVRGLEWPPSLKSIVLGSFTFRSRVDVAKWACQPPF